MLDISRAYLKEVLNKENFSKIKFISVEEYNNKNFDIISSQNRIDMAINIDSFQEMLQMLQKIISNLLEYV